MPTKELIVMAGSGPPPNPQSRRQSGNQANTWTDLPSAGYVGPIPAWPLGDYDELDTERELAIWSEIWRSPQAAAWTVNGWTHDVAMYVRYLVKGESGHLDSAKEARMWSDRLGLNPTAMLKNRWRIKSDELTERRESKPKAKSARERLKVAAADGVAGA